MQSRHPNNRIVSRCWKIISPFEHSLLQFLGNEYILGGFIAISRRWTNLVVLHCGCNALIFFGHSQVCVCGMSTTWFGVCRRILRHQQGLVLVKIFLIAKLQKTSSLDVFLGYLFSLLSKEKPSFEGGVRICLCKVLFLLGWCWGILRAVNMSGPPHFCCWFGEPD